MEEKWVDQSKERRDSWSKSKNPVRQDVRMQTQLEAVDYLLRVQGSMLYLLFH